MDIRKLKSEIRKSVSNVVKNKYLTGKVMLKFPEPDGDTRREIVEQSESLTKKLSLKTFGLEQDKRNWWLFSNDRLIIHINIEE